MCAHDVSGHGIGCQAVHTHIYIYICIVTNIQARARKYKLPHLTYLREARFACQ